MTHAYLPCRIPHPSSGHSLTRPQAEADLAYLLRHKDEPLQIRAAQLTAFDIDLDDGLTGDPAPLLARLSRWRFGA